MTAMLDVLRVNTTDLQLGMYVSGLDRPWLETPFPLQGFHVSTPEDIGRLQQFCQYVYVDSRRSAARSLTAKRHSLGGTRKSARQIFPGRRLQPYRDAASWNEEYPRAQAAVDALTEAVGEIFRNVAAGRGLDVVKVKKSVDPMIDSISRNPDACIWLARMKQQDSYTYQHSVGASIWAVALGRQLGLPRSDLRTLAIGGLLFDVGKLRVREELLKSRRQLSDDEFEEVKSHVQLGVDMIRESGLMNEDVLDMVAHHHERHNGSGYPQGLSGDTIPVHARIAAIVDCYDAITSHRGYARGVPPATAIKMLYDWRNVDFQAELVEEFIQAVGIYPAGSLVELSSGEVAVVVAEYRTRRLRPKVMILLDADKQPLQEFRTLDLLEHPRGADGRPLEITGSLEPEAYGIDMSAVRL